MNCPNTVQACKPSILVLFIIVIIMVLYWVLMNIVLKGSKFSVEQKDFMNKKIFNLDFFGESCCSYWALSHFVLFFILGFLFPQCHMLLFVAGVIWELLENIAGYFHNKFKGGKSQQIVIDSVEYKTWWAASFKDIIVNAMGIYLGVFLKYGINSLSYRDI